MRRNEFRAAPAEVQVDLVPIQEKKLGEDVTDYLSDAPIEDSIQDRFRRENWTRRIAETIAAQGDPASLVVGIYGPWGDGKTVRLT